MAGSWALVYGLYRLYYAVGGTYGILGTPRSWNQWALINGIAGALLVGAALLPIALLTAWIDRKAGPLPLAISWVIAVGCISHALIGVAQRVLSLAGILRISYPFWATINRQKADMQALVFNEPWFLIEGLLWVSIAWHGKLWDSHRRIWWLASAALAIATATVLGLLSSFGVIGKLIVG